MKFKVEFRKEALQDLLDAIDWYEKQVPGLGDEFYIAFSNEIKIIQRNPLLDPTRYKNIRKAITRRFPYIIYFLINPSNKIVVIAILHMKRGSFTWSTRIKK